MHGGYTDLIDFEKALKNGAGADFHDTHGYAGMMGDIPEHLKKKQEAHAAEKMASTGAPPAAEATKIVKEEEVVSGGDEDQVPVMVQAAKEAAKEQSNGGSCSKCKDEGSCGCQRAEDEL